jgi:Sulfatase
MRARTGQAKLDVGRRDTLKAIGAGTIAVGTGLIGGRVAASAATPAGPRGGRSASGPYNILFIVTDQERHFGAGELPRDYVVPAHQRLAKAGIVFENHQINSCMCTPSRSVLYTGQHIQHARMFDNTNFPWISSMSTDISQYVPGATEAQRLVGPEHLRHAAR